ncbi:hypothetical protein DSLASN_10120 [Desulfoluna limicola]|uniref:Uncharacterized protein n=1 Tax=Desulfoluna limicola TaxID=2810562 RepID=A0ABM7PCS6_9BACT|nr:hypothetical protein DSLASN_10120 [Desulfoluna limicola]
MCGLKRNQVQSGVRLLCMTMVYDTLMGKSMPYFYACGFSSGWGYMFPVRNDSARKAASGGKVCHLESR